MCSCARVMSEEKQATVKYELSQGGELKWKFKREKTAEHEEWVTENRGNGLGKLVLRKKSPASLSGCPKSSGLHVDKQTEQVPVLRLSLTSNVSSDKNRQVQVKSWSLCEPEDVSCMSELSPVCQLQQSPKDSGVDMSSPPHDDGTVGVEPNVGTGVWSVNDSHNGDSSAVEEEKTNGVEKLETAVDNFVDTVHSGTKEFWSGAASLSSESEQLKVQSTLRSRVERTAFKCFSGNSQKLINPLAKTHRVGRYQHMLPVHRIRAESNVSRRSSIEESPTYNMVAPRTTSCSGLPRVKTKLKLLSNNIYTAVDQEVESSKQQVAEQKSKCLNVEKSKRAVVESHRNRFSRKSSVYNAFENMKVKLCYSNKSNQHVIDGDKIQRVPKLKLVVKPEQAVSVSCVAHRQDEKSVTATVKRDEENMPRHIRRKRRYRATEKTKACGNNMSADLCHPVDSSDAGHIPSTNEGDNRSKRKSFETTLANVERSGKKKKVQDSAEQETNHVPLSFDSQKLLEDDHIDKTVNQETVHSIHDKASADKSWSFIHTDKLSTGQAVVVYDALSEMHTDAQEEGIKTECSAADVSTSSTQSVELNSNGCVVTVTDSGRGESLKENHCSEDADCGSERRCTVSDHVTENADDGRIDVDGVLEERLHQPDAKEEVPTAVKHDSTSDCCGASDEKAVITDEQCVVIANVSSDDGPTSHTSTDHDKTEKKCAEFYEEGKSSAAEQMTTTSSDSVVPLSPSLLLPDDNSVFENITSTVVTHSSDSIVNKSETGNLQLTLKPAEVTEGTSYYDSCLLYTSPSPRDRQKSRMPSSA